MLSACSALCIASRHGWLLPKPGPLGERVTSRALRDAGLYARAKVAYVLFSAHDAEVAGGRGAAWRECRRVCASPPTKPQKMLSIISQPMRSIVWFLILIYIGRVTVILQTLSLRLSYFYATRGAAAGGAGPARGVRRSLPFPYSLPPRGRERVVAIRQNRRNHLVG